MKKFHVFSVNSLLSLGLMGVCVDNAQAQPWSVTDVPIMQLNEKYDSRKGKIQVLISPDGKMLTTAAESGPIQLWDLGTGAPLQTLDLPHHRSNLVYTRDGRLLAASWMERRIRVWDVLTNEELFAASWDVSSNASVPQSVRFGYSSIHLSPNGVYLAATMFYVFEPRNGKSTVGITLKVWNIATGNQLTLPIDWEGMDSFAFSPDGAMLAVGFLDSTVEVWDVVSGKVIKRLTGQPGNARITAVSFRTDGQLLAAVGGGKLLLWEMPSGKQVQTITGVFQRESGTIDPSYATYIPIPVFSPDGTLIATGSEVNRSISDESHIVLWDVATGEQYKLLPGRADSVAFSPDGKLVVTGGGGEELDMFIGGKMVRIKKEGTVRIWVR